MPTIGVMCFWDERYIDLPSASPLGKSLVANA
jgi:hypothetical protein